jgi:hypothetical protein
MSYRRCLLGIVSLNKIMLIRGIGIRDISVVLRISMTKVLNVLKSAKYKIKPLFSHYDCLEIDEFWTDMGKNKNKIWRIYVYHLESGKIVMPNQRFAVWGKGDSFLSVFGENNQGVRKKHTVGIDRKAFDMAFFYFNYGFV